MAKAYKGNINLTNGYEKTKVQSYCLGKAEAKKLLRKYIRINLLDVGEDFP